MACSRPWAVVVFTLRGRASGAVVQKTETSNARQTAGNAPGCANELDGAHMRVNRSSPVILRARGRRLLARFPRGALLSKREPLAGASAADPAVRDGRGGF